MGREMVNPTLQEITASFFWKAREH